MTVEIPATATEPLVTYQDMVEHVLDRFDVPRNHRNARMARRAVNTATRTFANYGTWKRFVRIHKFQTNAPEENVTATYTESTRAVTRASGSWPTWAGDGQIKIGTETYQVQERTSATVLTIRPEFTPGDDVASGNTTLSQNLYLLPTDVDEITELLDENWEIALEYGSDGDAHAWDVLDSLGIGEPHTYSIVGHPNQLGRMAFRVTPSPQTARIYSASYFRRVSATHIAREEAGTITIDGSPTATTTVTGTSTAFSSNMVGCVLRVGSTSASPGPAVGGLDETDITAQEERIITAVTNATTLTVDSAISSDYSDVKYTISSLVDLDQTSVRDALFRLAESEFARSTSRNDADQVMGEFWRALEIAKAGDVRHNVMQSPVNFGREWSRIGNVDVTP